MNRKEWILSQFCSLLSTFGPSVLAASTISPAPLWALPGLDGQAVTLDQFAGKVVYLDFWASWCGPCRQSFPWLNEMQSRYEKQGLAVIGVNLDKKRQAAEKFLLNQPAQFRVLLDPVGATARSYGVNAMPSSFLIGRQGQVAFKNSGFVPSDKPQIEARIRQALGLAVAGMAISLLSACAITPVEAWDKGHLANTEMTFDADKLEAGFADHTYFSKEGSSGGRGVGGGGCGCN